MDLAEVTLELLKLKAFGIYHITNNTPCSRFEWAEFVLEELKWPGILKRAKQKDFNLPAKRPKIAILDNFGLYETLGIRMRDWKESTRDFIENYILGEKI